MLATVQQYLEGIPGDGIRRGVSAPLKNLASSVSSVTLQSGALRIHGGSASPLVQTNATYYGTANGKIVTIASATDLPALVGTVANAMFNVFVFMVDSAGNRTSQIGAPGATLAQIIFPQKAEGKATIGFVIINPTGTGAFVGGTTNLDDATVVPNAVFINTGGSFDPTIIPG